MAGSQVDSVWKCSTSRDQLSHWPASNFGPNWVFWKLWSTTYHLSSCFFT